MLDSPERAVGRVEHLTVSLRVAQHQFHSLRRNLLDGGTVHHLRTGIGCGVRLIGIENDDVALTEV